MTCACCADPKVYAKGLCRAHYVRQWRDARREQIRASERAAYALKAERMCQKSQSYYAKNAATCRAKALARIAANVDVVHERARRWRAANKAKVRQANLAWRAANPGAMNAYKKRLRAATPPWADMAAIRAVYADARRRTIETGDVYEVDHEIPVQGRNVCGLHVHHNLRVLLKEINRAKSNVHVP